MIDFDQIGKKVDTIDVKISYRIIELFSAGLYSSPNKAFEELVCNSYDAFADKVAVYVPSDLTATGANIWICDNGESMDQDGLKDLWKIGISNKRDDSGRDQKRLQIGRFGIGKLATYILANKLTYICKKDGRFLSVTMNYEKIGQENENLQLDEREIQEQEAEKILSPYYIFKGKSLIPYHLFGENAEKSWTFSILTSLKPKSGEIREGRLKWVLQTAIPLNPGFNLYYNGNRLESSKINKPIKKKWKMGEIDNDITLETFENAISYEKDDITYVDFENLKEVHGEIILYEDSLVDASKSTSLGRSHGIFLLVRGRLINLDDPLLGMEAFSHGVFNRTQIFVHADELDENLTSTREAIKDSTPLNQLKDYLKKKFNNEVRKYYYQEEEKKHQEQSISFRLSQTSLTLSKRPLYVFAEKFFDNEIKNPFLIEKPPIAQKTSLLQELKNDLSGEESIIKNIKWEILQSSEPITKFDLVTGDLKINLMHPYIANYNDAYTNLLPLQFFAITEVLTEAYLYELGIEEAYINNIMKRRDDTFRELSLSDREGSPLVAQLLKDALADSMGLEDAVYRTFLSLGFECNKIGGKSEPDGIAFARLGFSASNVEENYSLTFDAKSTKKEKIKASTTNLAIINKHKEKYQANYAAVIAIDFEGAEDEESSISLIANQQKVTIIKATDLIRLLLLSVPKQIGLKKIKELFDNCYSPSDVSGWIDNIQKEDVKVGPIRELLETIYELQVNDTEPPEIAGVRQKLNEKIDEPVSKNQIIDIMNSLKTFVPGFVSVNGDILGIQGTPKKIMEVVQKRINDLPNEIQRQYLDIFTLDK